MNILTALDDPNVFGPFFKARTWARWRVFMAALFGLPLSAEQLTVYRHHTGRSTSPTTRTNEAWLVIGRPGGKSFVLATIAVFLACFIDWRPRLGPGEQATIMIIAADRRQAKVIKRYIAGLLKAIPMLAQTIVGETAERIELKNRVSIEIHTASFRSTRGYTCVACLCGEIAFWPTDESSSEPDVEVLNAIRPTMATIPGAMLLAASSPHARKGALYSAYSKHFGKAGDPVLVWKATTREMNATVPQSYIDSHLADDPARAGAEYLAEFRSDLEAFVQREVIEACIGDYFELSPTTACSYYAHVDPAGGSGQDSFTLAIAHSDDDRIIVDLVREVKPPFAPTEVIDQFIPLLASYRISNVTGDRWAGGFPPEQFQKRDISYEPSKEVKSDLYRTLLPLLNSGKIVLPRSDRLVNQLLSLERRVARGGHDTIDHPREQHDDLANAVAGVAAIANKQGGYDHQLLAWADCPPIDSYGRHWSRW